MGCSVAVTTDAPGTPAAGTPQSTTSVAGRGIAGGVAALRHPISPKLKIADRRAGKRRRRPKDGCGITRLFWTCFWL